MALGCGGRRKGAQYLKRGDGMNRPHVTYNGAVGYRAIAELTGVPMQTLQKRVKSYGMTIEQAVKHKRNTNAKHEWNGHYGVRAIAEAAGVTIGVIKYAIREQVCIYAAIEEAKNLAKAKAKKPRKKSGDSPRDKFTPAQDMRPVIKLALGIITREKYDEIKRSEAANSHRANRVRSGNDSRNAGVVAQL